MIILEKQKKSQNITNMPRSVIKHFSKSDRCMAYGCTNPKNIQSHTISEKHLKNIAKDGHAWAFEESLLGEQKLVLTGIKQAEIFPGFCREHDNDLFKIFEDKDFIGSYNQIYALTFRILSRQYFDVQRFMKLPARINQDLEKEHGKDYIPLERYYKKNRYDYRYDLRNHKFIYEQYKRYTNHGLFYRVYETSLQDFAASGIYFPMFDYKGNPIQPNKNRQHGFIYTIFPENNKSYIIIATVKSLHNNSEQSIINQFNFIDFKVLDYLLSIFLQNAVVFLSPKIEGHVLRYLERIICSRAVVIENGISKKLKVDPNQIKLIARNI